jgi:hypothetical protein
MAYGGFAGKLEVTSDKINFIDALLPSQHYTSQNPRGMYSYSFNGKALIFGGRLMRAQRKSIR